jgi:hypothetical protein
MLLNGKRGIGIYRSTVMIERSRGVMASSFITILYLPLAFIDSLTSMSSLEVRLSY